MSKFPKIWFPLLGNPTISTFFHSCSFSASFSSNSPSPSPSSFERTTGNWKTNVIKEINNGPIAQFKQMMDTNGKIFQAEECDFSLSLPRKARNLKGETVNLNKICEKGKLTLVSICFSNFSHDMTESFSIPWKRWMNQDNRLAYLNLQPINGWIKWMLYGWLARMDEKRYVDENDHDRCIVFKSDKQWMEECKLNNGLGAYTYLLDENARVRWRASGHADEHELNALTGMIEKLLKNTNKKE